MVVHAERDHAWVHGYLLPELGLPDGAVLTPAGLTLGAPRAAELERAVLGAGTVVLVLTPDMPYELLTYALKETAFPRQSTGDQFFDHAQFDAYRALGYHIGTAALTAGKPPTTP